MRPVIGVFGEVDEEKCSKIKGDYISALEDAGGLPVLLPYSGRAETVEGYVGLCNGFLFSGGVDIEPSRYGETKKESCGEIQLYRDELELLGAGPVFRSKKPVMAICRGIQLVNVALGGTLYQDIPSEIKTDIEHRQTASKYSPSHFINVTPGTPLYAIAQKTRIAGNSFHHQSVKTPGKGLEIMAKADDGVIEALYGTGEQYIRAYQWHPERLYRSDGINFELFADFIRACEKTRREK